EAKRLGAHCRQVADTDRQGSLAKKRGIAGMGKVHAGHQRVAGHGQLHAGRRLQQGTVVANAQNDAFGRLRTGRGGEVAADQLELTHDGRKVPGRWLRGPGSSLRAFQLLPARTSAARSTGASLSSTPLTNLCPSVAPNTLASSMPSLITTL